MRVKVFSYYLVFFCLSNILTPTLPVTPKKPLGVVTSAHPLATKAGLDILKAGGNAFDAAIAVAAALNVVEPMMSGIGGYGTILIYDATTKKISYLNSSGRIPFETNSDLMRPPTTNYLENRVGAKSVSTPGNLHAWEAMHTKYGHLKWEDLFTPAIELAENGFEISPRLANSIEVSFKDFSDYTRSFYGRRGTPLKTDDMLFQKDLAGIFRGIAKNGAKEFYQGSIAESIDSVMRATNGFLRKKDLQQDQAEWYDAIRLNYKGYEVYTAAPPSNAFAAFISMGIMQQPAFQNIKWNSPEYFHLFAEATKQSYAGRLRLSYDPELESKKIDELLTPAFFASVTKKIDLNSASAFTPFETPNSQNTTHFVVADQWGNIVSATQTLGNIFGSRIMAPGTGIWLNNSLAYCTYEPKGNPMDAFPGRHKLSGDCPVIIMKDDLPWAALGSPGGHTITQNIPQIVFNLIDGHLSIQDAINAPKIVFAEPDVLVVEAGLPDAVKSFLTQKGHKQRTGMIGNAHGITIDYDKNRKLKDFKAAADKRGEGAAQVIEF